MADQIKDRSADLLSGTRLDLNGDVPVDYCVDSTRPAGAEIYLHGRSVKDRKAVRRVSNDIPSIVVMGAHCRLLKAPNVGVSRGV